MESGIVQVQKHHHVESGTVQVQETSPADNLIVGLFHLSTCKIGFQSSSSLSKFHIAEEEEMFELKE